MHGARPSLGIRPEHLDVVATGPAATLQGNADVVEYLGNEELIHVSAAGRGHRRASSAASIASDPATTSPCRSRWTKIHLFDAETGLSLRRSVVA